MQGFLDKIKGKDLVFAEHIENIELNRFIFETANESPSTFEIQPSLLGEISRYYFNVGNAIDSYYASGKESPSALIKTVKLESETL